MRAASILLVILISPLVLHGQNQAGVEDPRASIVKITSQAPGEQPRTGTGFIVSVDGEIIYIVTASHVVKGDARPQVTFHHDQMRPIAAEMGQAERDNELSGLGFVIVRDRAIAQRVNPLPWGADILRGGEDVQIIGFGQGLEWGFVKGTVASIAGSDIKIDGRVEEGNSGGPIIMNGRVAGMVTAVQQGLGIGKSPDIVKATLAGWGVAVPRKYASLVGDWLGAPGCTLVFRVDNGRNVEGSCDTEGVRHEFAGVYEADDKVRVTITRIDAAHCATTVPGTVRIENDNTIDVSQDGWDGCQVKTGPASTRLKRSARR